MLGNLTQEILESLIASIDSEDIQTHIESLEETIEEANDLMALFEGELSSRGEEIVEEEVLEEV